jgi:flagellar assembly factor FliW
MNKGEIMKLETLRFGEIEIQDNSIISFSNGIPGFNAFKSYSLITMEKSPFKYLQSIDNKELSFILISPFDFFKSYEFDIQDGVVKELELSSHEQVSVYNLITVNNDLSTATVNLAAPIIINEENKRGVQYIIPDGKYNIRQPLFGTLIVMEGGAKC